MASGARTAYRALAWVFLAGIVVQFFLAGAGAFGAASWDVHAGFGYALAIASLVLLLLSLAGRWLVRQTVVLVGLVLVQVALVFLEEVSEWISSLHPVNALVLAAMAMTLVRRAGRPFAAEPTV